MKKVLFRILATLSVAAILSPVVILAQDHPVLPSGPPGPGPFGASYATLKYSADWDAPWRIGDHADIVVRFDDDGHRLVFWRGTSYIPCWVTETGKWYTNEFVERRGHHSPNTEGCVEPMSDKQCRYSQVRIIESNAARVVVHWRYAPVDVQYEHPFIDKNTGWFDWVDEYYTIYPDAVGIREITVETNEPDLWMEFQEAILVNQPGTLPQDNIEDGAVSVANMKGEYHTYVWDADGGPDFDKLIDANIMKINLKGKYRPFAIAPPSQVEGRQITTYKGHGKDSNFNWWDHWPISQVASDGNRAESADPPSHSSLSHIALHEPDTWADYKREGNKRTKIMVNGMTTQPVQNLVPLAKSWLNAAELKVTGKGYTSEGYDPTEMAYHLSAKNTGKATALSCTIDASADSPAVNPALVIKGWGESDAKIKINGKKVKQGKDVRVGHRTTLDGTDLIIWIRTQSTKPVTLSISPA